MIFNAKVAGIPCQVKVTYYTKVIPMRITGSGFGDCEPPEPEEFEFQLLDRKGYPARWLEEKLTPAIELEIYRAFKDQLEKLNHEDD